MASPGYIASCCLGNKSVFINSDIPSSHALLQERAVSGVGLTFGILSIVGLFVVLYPWRCMRKQSLQRVSQHLQGPNLSHVVHCIIAAGINGNIGKLVCCTVSLAMYEEAVSTEGITTPAGTQSQPCDSLYHCSWYHWEYR